VSASFERNTLGPSLGFILLRRTKDCAQDDRLGELDVKGVDCLGTDVADKDRSTIRGEAAPGSDGAKVAPEVFQADHEFALGLSDFDPTVGLVVRILLSK